MQNRIRGLVGALLAAGLCTGVEPAAAQSTYHGLKPSWYLMPQVSAFDPDSSYRVGDTGWGGALRLGKPLTQEWELQLSGGHARESERGNKIEQSLLGLDVVYVFSRTEWRPYFSIGAGAERDKRSLAGVQTRSTSPYASAAVGLRYMFNDSLGVQAEYRRVEGFLRDSAKWGFNRSGNNYYTLGLIYNFGVEPPPPKPAPKPVEAPPPPKVAAAPPPPKKVDPPPPPPPVQTITLDATRLFELNSARIPGAVPELDNFASALNANPQITSVVITGHTDQLGTAAYNQGLSQRRAESVRAYLVGKGVAANRLTARGVGSTQLVVNCKERTRAAMISCGQPNRRVVVEPITITKR